MCKVDIFCVIIYAMTYMKTQSIKALWRYLLVELEGLSFCLISVSNETVKFLHPLRVLLIYLTFVWGYNKSDVCEFMIQIVHI